MNDPNGNVVAVVNNNPVGSNQHPFLFKPPSSPTSCFICGDLSMPSTSHLYRHLLSHSQPDLAMAVISLSEQHFRANGGEQATRGHEDTQQAVGGNTRQNQNLYK